MQLVIACPSCTFQYCLQREKHWQRALAFCSSLWASQKIWLVIVGNRMLDLLDYRCTSGSVWQKAAFYVPTRGRRICYPCTSLPQHGALQVFQTTSPYPTWPMIRDNGTCSPKYREAVRLRKADLLFSVCTNQLEAIKYPLCSFLFVFTFSEHRDSQHILFFCSKW